MATAVVLCSSRFYYRVWINAIIIIIIIIIINEPLTAQFVGRR